MRYQKFLDYTRSRSLQTTTSSPELASHEEVLLARHAVLPNAWRTPKYVCVGGYNRVACWKFQRLDNGVRREVRQREGKGGREVVFFPAHTFSAPSTQSDRLEQAIWPRAFPFSSGKSTGDEITHKLEDQVCASHPLTLQVYFLFEKRICLSHACHKISWINNAQSPYQVTQQNTNWII